MKLIAAGDKSIRHRYGWALGAMLLVYLLDGIESAWIQPFVDVGFIGVLVLIVFDPAAKKWAKVVGLALAGLSAAATVASSVINNAHMSAASAFLNAAVLTLVLIVILRRISTDPTVTLSTIMGAVLAYALLAFMFSNVYQGLALMNDGIFFAQGTVERSEFSYFSFVVLTTLGFGDLTPGTDIGQRIVVMEAFFGQVFLVVLVARLVSLLGSANPIARRIAVSESDDDPKAPVGHGKNDDGPHNREGQGP